MPNPLTSIRDYFRSSIAELKKVTWPSRDMTIRYAGLVIIVSAALAGFFAALDFGLSQVVTIALARKPVVETHESEPPVQPDLEPIEASATPVKIEAQPAETQPAPAPVGSPSEGGLQLPPLEAPKP